MMVNLLTALDPESAKTLGVVTVMLAAFVGALVYPIARAYARRLEDSAPTAGLREELAEVSSRLEELQRGQERMAELEGRIEFAERLLSQQREAVRIPGRTDEA
jgi:hypothetical protein